MMIMIMITIIIIMIIITLISGTTSLSRLLFLLGFSPIRLNPQVSILQFLTPAFLSLVATSIRFSLTISAVLIQDNFWHLTISQSNHMSSPYFHNDNDNNCVFYLSGAVHS